MVLVRHGHAADISRRTRIKYGQYQHLRAAMAADRAYEQWFKVGQPDVIRPAVGADLYKVGAFVIPAVDQHVTETGRAHLSKGDLLRTLLSGVVTSVTLRGYVRDAELFKDHAGTGLL